MNRPGQGCCSVNRINIIKKSFEIDLSPWAFYVYIHSLLNLQHINFKKDSGSNSGQCSPHVCVGFIRVLQFPPAIQKHTLQAEW